MKTSKKFMLAAILSFAVASVWIASVSSLYAQAAPAQTMTTTTSGAASTAGPRPNNSSAPPQNAGGTGCHGKKGSCGMKGAAAGRGTSKDNH